MEKHPRGEKLRPGGAFMKTEIYGSTAQFGKKSQTEFLPQFKVWKTKESCMYLRLSKKGFALF